MRVDKCYCGGVPEIHGSDSFDEEGPWFVWCPKCDLETLVWAYRSEAWSNFRSLLRAKAKEEKVKIAQQRLKARAEATCEAHVF